jgi:hypothetical protein
LSCRQAAHDLENDLDLLGVALEPKSAYATMWCGFPIDTRPDFSYDGHDRKYYLSRRPPALRVAWISPPKAGKGRGAKLPNHSIQIPAIMYGTATFFGHHKFLSLSANY